jgi:GNAT superfamily N-acetyltransferase
MKEKRGAYVLSDKRIDPGPVHALLKNHSYWATERSLETVECSIANSICHGIWYGKALVAFARLVTDRATFAWVSDVIVHPDHRGKALGKWIVGSLVNLPEVAGCQMILRTRDAHGLYEQFGFERGECMRRLPKGKTACCVTSAPASACAAVPGSARI